MASLRQQPGLLAIEPPPADLAPFVVGFVHRDDPEGGEVVRLLPELRTSIQIMIADPYWLRERAPDAIWEMAPRIGLWGPRSHWGYGYARRHVKAYAVGLTALGSGAVVGAPVAGLVDRVVALKSVAPDLAQRLDPLPDEDFSSWRLRATDCLGDAVRDASRHDPIAGALSVLAVTKGDAVAQAAEAVGHSERHFRRVFKAHHGLTPKQYQRTLRVDRMIRQLHERPWEADAFAADPIPFADQAHAIREFRALTGLTPLDYVRLKRSGDVTLSLRACRWRAAARRRLIRA